ncbi:MAG: amidase [Lysinibacillus sp.]
MKIKFILIIMIIAVIALVLVLPSSQGKDKPVTSTWLWKTEQIEKNPDQLLAFLKAQKVDVLYLQINRDISKSVYQKFIEKASKQQLMVHALGGSKSWTTESGAKKMQAYFDWLTSYQAKAKKEQRFSGMHIDIEPYLHDDWDENRELHIKNYQKVLSAAKTKADSLNLKFGVDMPFWFDKVFYTTKSGQAILSEWVIDTVDTTTIMSYRNSAQGRNGINELVKSEIAYAEKVGKFINVGVETRASSEGKHISFFNMPLSEMEKQLNEVRGNYRQSLGFNGIAIHSLETWQVMK